MKWSICVLTQPSRKFFLEHLLTILEPQVKKHPDIEITIRTFDKGLSLGSNRQSMIESAQGTYCNFCDDDDLVALDYVDRIYPLLDGVDYIGFQVQLFMDGEKQKPTFHSLRHPEWSGDQNGWYRDISHLNPIRRELALAVPMSGGFGEDQRWADGLRNLGIVKTEHYIDAVMYLYYFRSCKTDSGSGVVEGQAWVGLPPRLPECPQCGSTATALAGGMRRCNQCAASWV